MCVFACVRVNMLICIYVNRNTKKRRNQIKDTSREKGDLLQDYNFIIKNYIAVYIHVHDNTSQVSHPSAL